MNRAEVQVSSAGLSPLGWIGPETLTVLQELDISTDGLSSTGLAALDRLACRALVNLKVGAGRPAHLAGLFPAPVPDQVLAWALWS